ncbi:MAG: NADH-quinone oxidoreductase subunit L [Gammaproteobacteria bacterium]|jgi:NADH-quinone oxidoreductase subunit L|nr:NADH-quinone oxidoreductase subunit L [Gammaproteobacteria bacterium]MBT7603280.1 NADH-quinone oxidoreductase subunit L [Gammaproteobacteria bacterium]
MQTILFLIPILVLASSIIIGLSGNIINNFYSGLISTILVFISFGLSLVICSSFYFDNSVILYEDFYNWISIDNLHITIGYLIDKLSSIMLVVVLFISLVVHIYSIGYMKDEKDFKRFFSYIALFTFSMLLLVMSNNLIQLFIGWEGVGLISYLLIGYWHNKESAIKANLKAFLINRIGDMFFILGIVMIYSAFDSFDFKTIFTNIDSIDLNNLESYFGLNYIDFSCLFLFIGAMAKSAQIPLHVWLPDSMEGPTPISALIHAATMVTAGIFMVARLSPLYATTDFTSDFILIIGASTALFIGVIAIFENDIKKVIAYSTISQLGYMVAALGISAYSVSFFHLFTHAFFKALLFLCAGSIIMSLHHNQNIQNMGGLKSRLPVTYICFLIGTLSIIGFPLTSGFFSKDLILEVMLYENNTISYIAYFMLLTGALVTSIYSFRLLFLVFFGKFKSGNIEDIVEQSTLILAPLIILSLLSLSAGYFINIFIELPIFMYGINNINYDGLLNFIIHGVLSPASVALIVGFYFAKRIYKDDTKYKIFEVKIIKIFKQIISSKYKFDEFFILSAHKMVNLSNYFSKKFDIALIDSFIVNGLPLKINNFSRKLRNSSTGYLYHYAFSIVFSLVVIFGIILVRVL